MMILSLLGTDSSSTSSNKIHVMVNGEWSNLVYNIHV